MKKIKSRNVMQQPMDSYVYGIKQAQKVFPLGHIYFSYVLSDSGTPILREKSKSD